MSLLCCDAMPRYDAVPCCDIGLHWDVVLHYNIVPCCETILTVVYCLIVIHLLLAKLIKVLYSLPNLPSKTNVFLTFHPGAKQLKEGLLCSTADL